MKKIGMTPIPFFSVGHTVPQIAIYLDLEMQKGKVNQLQYSSIPLYNYHGVSSILNVNVLLQYI